MNQGISRNRKWPQVALPVCVATLIYLFLANISRMVGPTAKSHNITLNQHDTRKQYKPEVTSGATSGLCGNLNLPLLGGIFREWQALGSKVIIQR